MKQLCSSTFSFSSNDAMEFYRSVEALEGDIRDRLEAYIPGEKFQEKIDAVMNILFDGLEEAQKFASDLAEHVRRESSTWNETCEHCGRDLGIVLTEESFGTMEWIQVEKREECDPETCPAVLEEEAREAEANRRQQDAWERRERLVS